MNRRSGLGRGLGSLIPHAGTEPDASETPTLTEIEVAEISPNPNQPRVHFDEESLGELADSIAQLGLLQPILVRRVPDGYQLIAGERRWRAARRAGLTTVPAVVRVSDDVNAVEEALVENLHREDLTALEEAAAYLQLIEEFELTHDQVAQRIGKSRSSVTNTLRLLGLPPEVQRLLADGKLSAGHAKALLGTPDRGLQERLAMLAVEEGWSVRTMEDVVRAGGARPDEETPRDDSSSPSRGSAPGATGRLRPPGLLELEELLAAHLDTRVGVQMGSKRGKMTVEFADLEDLERIYRLIVE
jgi:ParB family chromosome partitioning protein